MKYEWDNTKAQINLAKHGVSFEEAQTVRLISVREATSSERENYEQS
jgi:uncharacterized DUF497 family protein